MAAERNSVDSFSNLLRSYRERAGLSQSGLARRAGLDPSFVNRLESGQRSAERSVVEKLVTALDLDPNDTDCLLAAGGHLPNAFTRVFQDPALYRLVRSLSDDRVSNADREQIRNALDLVKDPTLQIIVQILSDRSLSPSDREDFRQVIALIGRRWRRLDNHTPS